MAKKLVGLMGEDETKETKLQENWISEATGYLKMPPDFKKKYGILPGTTSSPEAFEREDQDNVELVYRWKKDQLKRQV